MFKINEAADMLHVNPNALRFYEKKGIIAPHRDENNYRMYTMDDTAVPAYGIFHRNDPEAAGAGGKPGRSILPAV